MPAIASLDRFAEMTLGEVFRYRAAFPTEFAKLPLFRDSKRVPEVVLERLRSQYGYLKTSSSYGQQPCYELTAKFAKHYQADFKSPRPMKTPEKQRAYAMLCFCLEDDSRQALNALLLEKQPELYQAFGENPNRPRLRDYYFVPPDRIGLLRVDREADTSKQWYRVVSKLEKDLSKHRKLQSFDALIKAGRFEFAIATPHEEKAEWIRKVVSHRQSFEQLGVAVIAVKELAQFTS